MPHINDDQFDDVNDDDGGGKVEVGNEDDCRYLKMPIAFICYFFLSKSRYC